MQNPQVVKLAQSYNVHFALNRFDSPARQIWFCFWQLHIALLQRSLNNLWTRTGSGKAIGTLLHYKWIHLCCAEAPVWVCEILCTSASSFSGAVVPVPFEVSYCDVPAPRLTFRGTAGKGWAVVDCIGSIRSSQVFTRGGENRLHLHQPLPDILLISPSSPICSLFFLPSPLLTACMCSPLRGICLFKGRNDRSPSIGRRESDLIILKRTWKADVVAICWW